MYVLATDSRLRLNYCDHARSGEDTQRHIVNFLRQIRACLAADYVENAYRGQETQAVVRWRAPTMRHGRTCSGISTRMPPKSDRDAIYNAHAHANQFFTQ